MEWCNENEESIDLTNINDIASSNPDLRGFCVVRVCSAKKPCNSYFCVALLT